MQEYCKNREDRETNSSDTKVLVFYKWRSYSYTEGQHKEDEHNPVRRLALNFNIVSRNVKDSIWSLVVLPRIASQPPQALILSELQVESSVDSWADF